MGILPLNDWMIVEEVKEEEKSKGGIVLVPEITKMKPLVKRGKVLMISDDIFIKLRREKKELKFEVGDIVYFHKDIGIPLHATADNKEFLMKYESVMGKGIDNE